MKPERCVAPPSGRSASPPPDGSASRLNSLKPAAAGIARQVSPHDSAGKRHRLSVMGPKTYRFLEITMWIAASIAMAVAVFAYLKRP